MIETVIPKKSAKDRMAVVLNTSELYQGDKFVEGQVISREEALVFDQAEVQERFGVIVLKDAQGRYFRSHLHASMYRMTSFAEFGLVAYRCNACGKEIVEEDADLASDFNERPDPSIIGVYEALREHHESHPNLGLQLDVLDYFTRFEVIGGGEHGEG